MHAWLPRSMRNGAPWVTLVLALLIATEIAHAVLGMRHADHAKSTPAAAAPVPSRPPVDVHKIAAAHLFGAATVDPSTLDSALARPAAANLVLVGTIATDDPKHGIAIIGDGGPSKVYSVGGRIGDASLFSVYLDHVLLQRGTMLETLALPRLLLSRRPMIARDAVATTSVSAPQRAGAPGIYESVRLVDVVDRSTGKLNGFRVYPGRNPQHFMHLGLHPADLVIAVNGKPLDDASRSQELLNAIGASDRAVVTVQRGRSTEEIVLNAEAATDAQADAGGAAGFGLQASSSR